jgi:hypothetical protein
VSRRRRIALVATMVAPSALMLALAAAVTARYRIPPPERLGPEARAAAMAPLRAALDGEQPVRPEHPELERGLQDRGPVVVTVWDRGRLAARVAGRGDRLADAIVKAAEELAGSRFAGRPEKVRRAARLQIDVVTGRGALLGDVPGLRYLVLQPGVDGLAAEAGGQEYLLLPSDLVRHRLLNTERPLPFLPDFFLGFDRIGAERHLASEAGLPLDSWQVLDRRHLRVRTDSFVEAPNGERDRPPLELTRGVPPPPELTAEELRRSAIAGGQYLVRHLAANGRYIYERHLGTGRGTDPTRPRPYSLPRHAGTTYFLAELYRLTGEEFLREPIERAFRHFAELVEDGGCTGRTADGAEFACVRQAEDRFAGLGSTALAVVALVEYRRATDDGRYDALARSMAEWILLMQRPDGSFRHRYDVAARLPDEDAYLLYFSGEAALALARMHEVYGDERYRDATERALDDLVGWYDFFGGGFFYGEEHWTCIAAEAAWPALKHDRYRSFCDGYGEFLRRHQIQPGDFDELADQVGNYGVSPFIIPNNTPVGSRSEALISAYLLGSYHGRPSEPLRRQILRSMAFALGQEVTADSAFWVPSAATALGAMPASPVDPTVRIDYVQHVGSAMIRALPLLEPAGAGR